MYHLHFQLKPVPQIFLILVCHQEMISHVRAKSNKRSSFMLQIRRFIGYFKGFSKFLHILLEKFPISLSKNNFSSEVYRQQSYEQ
jgi:hypothetical protein